MSLLALPGQLLRRGGSRLWTPGGAAAPPPDPSTVANLFVWHKANSLGLADLAAVTSWTDLSGGGRHSTEATNPPVFRTNQVNGLAAIRFDSPNRLNTTNWSALTAGECFFVTKRDDAAPASDTTSCLHAMTASASASHYPEVDTNIYEGWGTTSRRGPITHGALNQWRIYGVQTSATHYEVQLDGASLFSDAGGNTAFPVAGRFGFNNATFFYAGYIAEYIMYSRILSGAERTTVMNYLLATYGAI